MARKNSTNTRKYYIARFGIFDSFEAFDNESQLETYLLDSMEKGSDLDCVEIYEVNENDKIDVHMNITFS